MDSAVRARLTKQRSVARGMLTRIQSFLKAGEQKLHEIQVRFNKLPDNFCKYESAQDELECSDDKDHTK